MEFTNFSKAMKGLRATHKDAFADLTKVGHVHRVPLDSPGLNKIFGGGYPLGKIIELFGKESSGKTWFANYIAGHFQREQYQQIWKDLGFKRKDRIVFVDLEYSFDADYASRTGLVVDDEERFIYVRPDHGEQAFTIIEDLAKTGEIAQVIVDSVATMPSQSQMTDVYGKATFGATAKLMSEGLKKLNPILAKSMTGTIWINQVRDNVGAMGNAPSEKTTGGKALPFYAHWRGKVSRVQGIEKGSIEVGSRVQIKNWKSKICTPRRVGEFNLMFAEGLESEMEYIQEAIDLGIIVQTGSWFAYGDHKVSGKAEIARMIREAGQYADITRLVNAKYSNPGVEVTDDDDDDWDEEEITA